jgi:hypothetical protein
VVDFGIAKALVAVGTGSDERPERNSARDLQTLTALATSLGTPAYMAPEQAAGDPDLDHRADIYAVGVLGYELLAGRTPFTGTPQRVLMAHITQQPPPLASPHGDIPPALVGILMKCLEKNPEARYQSADELLVDLEALTTPPGGVARLVGGAGGRRWLIPISITALVATAAVAWVGTSRGRRERWMRCEPCSRDRFLLFLPTCRPFSYRWETADKRDSITASWYARGIPTRPHYVDRWADENLRHLCAFEI